MDALLTIPADGATLITRATAFPVNVSGVRISTPEEAQAAPIATYVPPPAAKPKGASSRTIWKCRVVDPSKLDRAYLMPNQMVLDALAASAKGVGAAHAGCEWTSSDSLSIR